MGGAMLAQYFVGAVKDLVALSKLKKSFHEVTAKLQVDELKIQTVLGQVKLLTKEKDQLSTSVTNLTLQNKTLTEEKQKALDEAKAATDELELLCVEVKELKKKDEESQREIENLGRLWEESAGVYFHVAIKKKKFLNPEVELKTQGMSTLCLVENGKWYHAQTGGNVECEPDDEEPASPVLEADVEEDEGPEEEGAVNEEKVAPQADGE
ncbi:putative UV radiation resistance-associated protein-like [Sesbania bispinosa]|nr:putative UV radiation resistance-associated protein-like [Sesbania bispinosa]